jgi:hypothetical protein
LRPVGWPLEPPRRCDQWSDEHDDEHGGGHVIQVEQDRTSLTLRLLVAGGCEGVAVHRQLDHDLDPSTNSRSN